jgi:signal transduction histidine kinase
MVSYEAVLLGAAHQPTPVQVYARQVHIDGQPFLQWILRDISERKKLDSLRDDLISMIYHDLRSPLTNVVSSLDVLGAAVTAQNEPAFRSLLNIAVRSTERIQRLTNSLLDINRLEAGQAIVNRQEVDVTELVAEAVDAVQPLTANKNQELTVELPPELPPVLVDGDMIRRVLINLMENAVKFSPTGGTVTLGAAVEAAGLRLWVSDTGPGIPTTEQERIFDKFTRLNIKEGPRGLGLGLAFCRLAILGHGGRIWVEAAAPTGARFVFTLPRVGAAANAGREHAASGS